MATGLPDLVDYARLAEEGAALERVYELGALPRLKDVLAEPRGKLNASFAFSKSSSGRAGVKVAISASPQLICQRCLQGYALPVNGGSDVEFAGDETADASDADLEVYRAESGLIRWSELAEEELLLALPIVPACTTPQSCGNAPAFSADTERAEESNGMRRPFSALQDLLKKT
jgi:uncharacterized protein